MFTKLLKVLLWLVLPGWAVAQADFPYTISLEPIAIPGMVGLHSYAHAQHDGKWLLLGGRLDGIHARQPFNAFPASQNNDAIWVVDPAAGTTWSAPLTTLPTGLKEQLQSTNMQFFQDGDHLFIVGGYAYSPSQGDHITFPNLTVVDVPGLVGAVVSGTPIAGLFQQLTDDKFAVTGGYFGKIGDELYLVGGHRFDGRYNPMGHATYVQTYTDAIRKFRLENNGGTWALADYAVISDPVHLHRRDYNLLPQLYPDGSFGYTIFSGVFQLNQDLPFLYPVDITASGHAPVIGFNQYLCNYHSAHAPLFDADANAMHNLFFGGISQYYFAGANMVQDDDVPFVKTISRVSRSANGNLTETHLPLEMPGYLGASAELILNPALPESAPGIVNLSAINADSFLLGHIVGGIESSSLNPFSFNNTDQTSASATVYKVFLKKTGLNPSGELPLPGYHRFAISLAPNPAGTGVFQIKTEAPEAGTIEVFMVDTTGRLLLNTSTEGLKQGKNTLEVALKNPSKGAVIVTAVLNGKFAATATLIFE